MKSEAKFFTYKHGIYELPHESHNALRLITLGNKKYQEISKLHGIIA